MSCEGHLQAEWARLLLSSLADAGISNVVVSPGSRSTPFVLAAVREPRLRLWDVIDERSAAFFALGQARVKGRPSLLLCTSGTAGANYLPAVVEAGMSHTPLLVLTADRPPELAHCGANQTIDQLGLFGHHARRFFDLGPAEASPRTWPALRRTAAQAVFACSWPEPGAVHLNARARKPLEPTADPSESDLALRRRIDALLATPIVRPVQPRLEPEPALLDELAAACRSTERGLFVAGPAPLSQAGLRPLLSSVAAGTGFPVFAEAASQLRFRPATDDDGAVFVDAFDALLRSPAFRRRTVPELIVQIGRSPTSGAWETWRREHPGGAHWVISPHGWHDPTSSASRMVFAEPGAVLRGLEDRLGRRRPAEPARRHLAEPSSWTEDFRRAEDLARRLADDVLGTTDELGEGAVAREVVAELPADAILAVGNSLPIRQVDSWSAGSGPSARVASQRGASGIDGVVSGAAGAASVAGAPVVLLVGDISFLHDLSGLATVRHITGNLPIVVVRNGGGRIFEQLPLASLPAGRGETLDHWLTPHEADLGAAAAVHGLPFVRATTRSALRDALRGALRHRGATVIEAVVPPHGAAEQNRRLWSRIDAALS